MIITSKRKKKKVNGRKERVKRVRKVILITDKRSFEMLGNGEKTRPPKGIFLLLMNAQFVQKGK